MPPFIDSEQLACDLDKIATKLSVFSIAPESAFLAAQRIRDLAKAVSVAEQQRDDAISTTASYFERPAEAPRRSIRGVEIETMTSSESYRVRFGETVPHSELVGADASVLFCSLVSEFARQLAERLQVQAECEFDSAAGSLSILGIVSNRSADMAMSIASYGFSVSQLTFTPPPRVEYDMPSIDADEEQYDEAWVDDCPCRICVDARRENDEAAEEELYAEPESERAISQSDENHWRTRGV